jgi:hypothetical protein
MHFNFDEMSMRTFFIGVLLLAVVSCSSTTDITKNPAAMTDFVTGQVYVLKIPVWIWNGSLMTLRDKEPADSEGVLSSGTKLVVRKAVVFRSPEVGTSTEVFAEVLTGDRKGKTVNVSRISQVLKTGYTKRDPTMLEPVEGESK